MIKQGSAARSGQAANHETLFAADQSADQRSGDRSAADVEGLAMTLVQIRPFYGDNPTISRSVITCLT